MPKLSYVWFWPNGGPVDGRWGPGGTAAEDAFARTSRRVTERYSEALATFEIPARRSAVQMFVSEAEEGSSSAVVSMHLGPPGDEAIRAHVPRSVTGWPSADRGRLVLEVVHGAMSRLGHERGWPQEALQQARDHAIGHHLGFTMTGPWKSSPSRRRRARPVVRLTDDGWGELSFEVADAGSDGAGAFTRPVRTPLNSLPKFRRSAKEFRWTDEATIERPDDWQVRVVSDWGRVDAFDVADLRPWHQVDELTPSRSPVPVEVRERGR